MVDHDTWPPKQPTSFIPLLLIHHQGDHTPEQMTAMAELMHAGDVDKVASVTGSKRAKFDGHDKFHKVLDTSKATKEIGEILAPLEEGKQSCFILIEGAPGIGKSVLLKEITYKWANKELLQKFELVLLVCLRDPSLHQIQSVDDLLRLICMGDEHATEIVSACTQYLFVNGGRSLTLLLDGYDEYPEHLRESSLVANILKRQVLPLCGLVVSSRPHASEHLREQATIRVDILGFTETEREHYIKQALPDQPHKIEELTQYLHQQPSLDSICFIPFNMVVLLYLYKLGIALPKNSTELYHHFICSTICRHLSKFAKPLTHDITDLTDLPEPYNRIIQQLSKLSLEALNNNKLIFTLHELTAACPDIAAIPGAINGFGLLQAVQHFGLYAKTMTLNFIHFTIQEFLAAHYITHLPPNEELKAIEENFWSDNHFNVITIYVSLTKGQRSSFKTFLSGGNEAIAIADKFLKDQLNCIRLYRCLMEAEDHIPVLCKTILQAKVFSDKIIRLKPTDHDFRDFKVSNIESLSLFISSSFNKQWKEVDLSFCHIIDRGQHFLYRRLRHASDVIINELWLDFNNLTRLSSALISDLTVKCKVKCLWINGNYCVGEDEQLYSMLINPSSMLEELHMDYTNLSSKAAIALFSTLKDNCKLRELHIASNAITDDACNVIITALQRNSCLVTLNMCGNPLSSVAVMHLVQSLSVNCTLELLGLPIYSQAYQKSLISAQEVVNKKRENQQCQVMLTIIFPC